ncbi:MAG: hypothetical protein HZB19_23250 [Chloroflexi bacterium]|nr:hypothetical protein [Chloroflexota bacterium]
MSEHTGNTQPIKPVEKDDTQPLKPVKKKTPRWRSTLIGILGFLLLIGLGAFGGYNSGIGIRENAKKQVISQQLTEQFQFALVDIEFGRYEAAKQRLEFIIANDTSFPGAQEKLTEVLVKSTIPTITPTATLTATPDFSGAESAFQRAQQLILAQDWPGALTALDQIRKLDATYKTTQVDGMYYFALRNFGYDQITKHGNLEGGIYQLTLAERFGPLDNTAVGLRDGARMYITGASFWELDWEQAVAYFSQVGAGWPSLWDGTMTAAQRYHYASMRYGDDLFNAGQFCEAYDMYQVAASLGNLDDTAAKNANQAFQTCYPPTEVPPTEIIPTATMETPIATEPPTVAPTP